MKKHLIRSSTVAALALFFVICFLGENFAYGAGFLDFPIMGYTSSTVPVTAVMDHDDRVGYMRTYTGEMGTFSDGCLAYENRQNVACTSSNTSKPRAYKRAVGMRWSVPGLNYQDGISESANLYMWYDNHRGYDFLVPRWVPVYASARGALTELTPSWGQITLDHSAYGYPYKTTYTHMQLLIGPLQNPVPRGALIGWVSNVAPPKQAVGTHLHFVVHKKVGGTWKMVDPYGGSGEPVLWK